MTEPLVVLPGMACSPRLWDGALAPGPDVRHGRLDQPTLDESVAALLAALPSRFALLGLSLGAIVAMALVRTAPQRVTRLCLTSTNARPPTAAQRAGWLAQRARLAAGETARDLQRDLLPLLLHERSAARDEAALAMADEVGAAGFDAQLAAQATRVDERPALGRIAVPTLVLAGAADALCPPGRHAEIAERIPGARLRVLDGVGHLAPLEDPQRVGEAVRAWRADR